MKKQTIEVFITDDGVQHKTEQAAIDHENSQKFEKLLDSNYENEDAGFSCLAKYADFKQFITSNKEFVLSILK